MCRSPWLPLLAAALLAPPIALAQAPSATPPSPEEVLGYPMGARFTSSAQIQSYARALAAATPLVEYRPYGRTPEQRELFQLVLTSAENRLRLEQIIAAHAELADPETSAARAGEIAATLPAVVYLTYGVHGNEASTSEAAMWTAWDLVRPGSESLFVLDSLVVVIDPVANPDGRERYVQWFHSVVGATPNPEPQAREHREPWPSGRYNHFLVDLNRDWAWATQPETRARLGTWWRWNPLVHVDFHEMHYASSYFFFPAAAPINPIYPDHIVEWGERFGHANAREFDARGWAYFTGDVYDLFYPGYGDSWPSLLGAVGMTYEQAGNGAAGLAVRRAGGDTLTLHDRALHHWTAGIATLRTAAASRRELMLDVAAGQRDAGRGQPDVLLVPGSDTLRLDALVEQLRTQGIAVERASSPFSTRAKPHPGYALRRDFPAGTYRVRARQARGRLATTLLAPVAPLTRKASYDISAWSLPYAYGVEAHRGTPSDAPGWSAVAAGVERPQVQPAEYGYLLPGDLATTPGIVRLLGRDVKVKVLSRSARVGGITWPPGSWFVPALGNPPLRELLHDAALGGHATPVSTGRAEEGIDLGSEHVWPLELPRVGLLTGDATAPTSFGAHWFFLERTIGLPFDALLLDDITQLDLSAYDVLVVPDLPGGTLDIAATGILREWVSDGGRLVAVSGGAAAVASGFDVPLRSVAAPEEADSTRQHLQTRNERTAREREEAVAGVILPVRVDSMHPLAWGTSMNGSGGAFVLHDGTIVFEPAPSVETVAFFPDGLDVTSGVISQHNLQRLEHGVWLASRSFGRGSLTLFADDPLFRLFWRQAHRFYLNSLLVGPRR